MSNDEIIAVVQAHKAGKKIQVKPSGCDNNRYNDCAEDYPAPPNWNFSCYTYRVKPHDPREWFLKLASDNSAFAYTRDQLNGRSDLPPSKLVLVREVLE